MWFFVKLVGLVAALGVGMSVYHESQWEREEYPGDVLILIRKSGDQNIEVKRYEKGQLTSHQYEGEGFKIHNKLYEDGVLVQEYTYE